MSSLCLCGVKEEFVSLKRSKDTSQTGRQEKEYFSARNLRLLQWMENLCMKIKLWII